jgi:hypothetical protein
MTLPSRRRVVVAFTLLGGGMGCRLGPAVCDTGVYPAITLEVRDATTGAPAAEDARGIVRDGAFVDSLRPAGSINGVPLSLAAATERAGTYSIEVHKVGYAVWTADNVRVGSGECGVEPVVLQAALEPTP